MKTQIKSKAPETISIIVHKLKNPIAVIKGYLEALITGDRGELNEGQKEYLNDAFLNVKEMSKNIDNLIDASSIDAKEYKLNIQEVDLVNLVEKAMQGFAIWAKAANCDIKFEKEDNIPLVLTDPFKIKKVIDNIVSNGIKYNKEKGEVVVSIYFDKEKNKVVFKCKDNGIGFPQEDYQKVFTKFYRSEGAVDIDPFGSGLSLYINKAIVELSGGEIWFETNKDKGVAFYFSLPSVKN